MKHLLVLLILLATISEATAQQPYRWTQLKGPNVGSTYYQLVWGAKGEIIAVAQTGYYVSFDEGNTWDFRTIINGNVINPQYFGLVISPAGEYYFYLGSSIVADASLIGIYKSTDFGVSWNHVLKNINVSQLIVGTDNSLVLQDFPEGNNYESIDRGNSWVQLPKLGSQLVACNSKYIYILNFNIYPYRFSNSSKQSTLFNTGNAGIPTYFAGYTLINDTLLLGYNDPYIYASNGEQNWDTVSKLPGVRNIIKGNGNAILANVLSSSRQGYYIASSTNNGKTWDSVLNISQVNQGVAYTSLNFTDLNNFLYEDTKAIYLSKDRGGSWKEVGFPQATIPTIIISNDGRIFADDRDNMYLTIDIKKSTDNGASWQSTRPPSISMYQFGKGSNQNTLCIAADSSNIVNVWEFDLTSPSLWRKKSSINNLFQMYYSSPTFIVSDGSKYTYIASGAKIYRSDDDAFSWINVKAPDDGSAIYSIEASSDGTLYFGTYPIMYRSDDHGSTWIKLEPVHDVVRLSYIKTFGTNNVLLGTEGDGLLLSSDKGNSWSRFDGNNFDTVTCIAINSKGVIAAATSRGLWIYEPLQQSWTKVTLGQDANLQIGGIDVAKNDDFYVGTYGSSVWVGSTHYNSVKYISAVHSVMSLSPNPTFGNATISLDLPLGSKIKLELYDVLGRRINILADGVYSGENQIPFNSLNLPNGIYTIILSGDKNETLKLVVNR